MPVGQSSPSRYEPGARRPAPPLINEGDCDFILTQEGLGKPGRHGWAQKPGKYPSRRVSFEAVGQEDENGKPMTVTQFFSSSPKAYFGVWDLANCAGYAEGFDIPPPETKVGSPDILAYCDAIDEILQFIIDNGVVLHANVKHEDYNGRTNARLNWLENTAPVAETEPAEQEETEEVEAEEEEEAAPVKPVAKKTTPAKVTEFKKVAGKKR